MVASDLKVGSTFELDGNVYQVVEKQHVSQPRLAAIIRTTLRNIETGQVQERRFGPGDNLVETRLEHKEMQYIYHDDELYYFMDSSTYEQIPVDYSTIKDQIGYIKENDMVTVHMCREKVISITPSNFVELEIVETDPASPSSDGKTSYKNAKLETGITIKVPTFIDNHEKIRIDTRTGEYSSRVK